MQELYRGQVVDATSDMPPAVVAPPCSSAAASYGHLAPPSEFRKMIRDAGRVAGRAPHHLSAQEVL